MYSGKTLHILNGDATHDVFKRSELKNEHYLIWREMLCEGPVTGYLHDPAFWKRREEYICANYSETPDGYFDKVIMEQIRLEAFMDDYSEIVLWFEHDLFCQVNLVALLSLISQHDLRAKTIFTVSINSHPELENFKGLGQLSPRQLQELLPHKKELNKTDLQFARLLWKTYGSEDARELEALISETPEAFPFLKNAMQLHLQRLPFVNSGLNLIDRKILETAATESLTKYELMRLLLEWDPGYGFTDLLYLHHINRLKPIMYVDEAVAPNMEGLRVLEGKLDFTSLSTHYMVGGISSKYRWNPELEQVVLLP